MVGAPRAVGYCTPETQRCRDARDYRAELRKCCRSHVKRIMSALVPLLQEYGAIWWADYGTLLGAVRNPMTTWAEYPWLPQEGRTTKGPHAGIIPHDKDADLCIVFRNWVRIRNIRPRMMRLGFNVKTNPLGPNMKFRLSRYNHTNVDLFFWHERHDGTFYRRVYAKVDAFKGREFHRDMLFPLTEVEWEGMRLPAPRDPEAWLEFRYGPNWRTPVMANNDGVRR